MSLERIAQMKAELEKKKAEKAKKIPRNPPVAAAPVTFNKRPSQLIEANVGDFTLYLFQSQLNSLFQKIWQLDLRENHPLDEKVLAGLLLSPQSLTMDLDYELVRFYIQTEFFFQVNEKEIVSYSHFKKFWKSYEVVESNFLKLTGKREFITYLTNKFKHRWVHEDGRLLSEDEYHILYRFEREPKSIERIFHFVNKHYFTLVNDDTIALFLKQIRTVIAQTIKEELLQITKETKI